MKILIHYPFSADEIEQFRNLAQSLGDHEVLHADSEDEAVSLAADAEVVMGHFRPVVCAAATNLRWIQSFSAGMDKFLFPEIVERDEVTLCNVAGLYAVQGAEHAWALLLALARSLPTALRSQDQHRWQSGPVVSVTGMTLGVVGMGGFGLEMVKRAQGYDMHILAVDAVRTEAPAGVAQLKAATEDNLHELLRLADVVMMACPLTKETYHLISTEEFNLMKPSAYLINVTRGGIIDEDALVTALQNNQIAGAALDVVEKEPLSEESPLWDAPNLILTPHRAGASQHRHRDIVNFFQQNLRRYLSGEPVVNVVDKRRGY
ncbi:D-2-hydroxyacid dehydrogenase [bacterium]|nr:D-2-hydroxyacid dehydrogenase [bacterium]